MKIYVQNKPLFLVDRITPEVEDYLHRPDTIFIDELNEASVKTMLHEMEKPQFYQGVFLHPDEAKVVEGFREQLHVIVAAGGLVYTPANELLLIHRLGHWDLPKGKLDEGETIEACAVREIEEETRAKNLTLEKPLLTTYHTYRQWGKHNLKESHWFLVKAAKKTALTPQTSEDISQSIWVPMKEIANYLTEAYPSVRDVLEKGISMLQAC